MLGNFATIAGTSLVRYMVWDGIRAADYLLGRDAVDPTGLAITGTSGGGFQSTWIGALDPRVAAVLPSCFPTALPMRMGNRIFEDPDSDPEQDPPALVLEGIDHPGLLGHGGAAGSALTVPTRPRATRSTSATAERSRPEPDLAHAEPAVDLALVEPAGRPGPPGAP